MSKKIKLKSTSILGAFLLTANVAGAAEISLNNLMFQSEDAVWRDYSYIGPQITQSLNETSSKVMELGHYALGLDNSGPGSRLLYLATAGQIHLRFQWANSLYFNHENVHFARSHAAGLTEHYFQTDDGERLTNQEAYWNIFLKSEVGGPATSTGAPGDRPTDDQVTDLIAGGVNAQMEYSSQFFKDALFDPASKNAFDASDLLINRIYTQSYALGDRIRYDKSGVETGDMIKYSNHIDNLNGTDDTLNKIILYSLAANILSPVVVGSWSDITEYVATADIEYDTKTWQTPLGKTTYDIPQHLNVNNYSLEPTVYFDASNAQGAPLISDKMLVSLSVDKPVIGSGSADIRVSSRNAWGDLTTDVSVTLAQDGRLIETTFGYAITDNLSVTMGGATSHGETLRGARLLGDETEIVHAGLTLNF